MKNKSVDIVTSFKKEEKNRKYVLIASLVFLLSSILPWIDLGFDYFGITMNGWNGILLLGVLASICAIVFWVLPLFEVKIGGLEKQQELVYKSLSAIILGSVIIFIIQANFSFSNFGIGFYLGFLSALGAVFFAFGLKINDIKKKLKK